MAKIKSLRKAQSKIDENFVEDISSKLLEDEDYHRDLFKQKRKQLLQDCLFCLSIYNVKSLFYL